LEATLGVDGDVTEGVQTQFDVCHAHVTGGWMSWFPAYTGELPSQSG
jgi:hypothetical protein